MEVCSYAGGIGALIYSLEHRRDRIASLLQKDRATTIGKHRRRSS
jgi:hypothetical protein